MKKQMIVGIVAVAVTVAVGLVIFQSTRQVASPPQAHELQQVSVRMKWFFTGTMTGWFSGKSEGIFEKHNIDLTITPGGPQNSSLKLVAAGSDTFGVAGADEVILARAKGVPVVALAVLFKESPLCYISKQESGIKQPSDWKGKKIEVSYGENAEYLFRALLKKAGLTKTDYTETPYTFNVAPFLEDKVDVSPAYAMDQALLIEKQGVEINKIFARDFGINPYADVIIATEKTIQEKPKLVRAFVDAVVEAHEWAIGHPDEAVTHLVKSVPDLKEDDQKAVWGATIPYIIPDGDTGGLGQMTTERWIESQQVLLDAGVLSEPIEMEKAYSRGFTTIIE